MTVAGVRLTLALPLGAMSFADARVIALHLGSATEALRMGYGQSSSGVNPELKKVFSDALRWQLQRILQDQVASSSPAIDHASLDYRYAEAWTFLSKRGVDAKWSLDDHERLIDNGWNSREAKAVADTVFDLQGGSPVSGQQIESCVATFGIAPTTIAVGRGAGLAGAALRGIGDTPIGRSSAWAGSRRGWFREASVNVCPVGVNAVFATDQA